MELIIVYYLLCPYSHDVIEYFLGSFQFLFLQPLCHVIAFGL